MLNNTFRPLLSEKKTSFSRRSESEIRFDDGNVLVNKKMETLFPISYRGIKKQNKMARIHVFLLKPNFLIKMDIIVIPATYIPVKG